MKIWTEAMVEAAQILARAGYTSSVAADALGLKRGTVLGRSCRMHEFKFTTPRQCKKRDQESHDRDVASAKALISGISVKPLPKPRPKIKKPMAGSVMVPVGASKRPNQPQVCRVNAMVEAPLSAEERDLITKDEGANEFSVPFSEMERHHCRWSVGKDEFGETLSCGRNRASGSSYCAGHTASSISRKQPKKISPNMVYQWDQSTKLVEAVKKTGSSPLKKNYVGSGNSSY